MIAKKMVCVQLFLMILATVPFTTVSSELPNNLVILIDIGHAPSTGHEENSWFMLNMTEAGSSDRRRKRRSHGRWRRE